MNPQISVIIVTYQHCKFIKQCLDGVLTQKVNFDYEIILGEDDSTDGTREICIEYAKNYPDKIKLFLRSRKDVIFINGSPTGRFNFIESLRAAKGRYIAICEGDDYWTDPLKLQKQFDVLETNTNLVGCFHNSEERYWNDYSRASTLFLNFPKAFEITIKELTQYNMVPTASLFFRSPIPNEIFTNEFSKLVVGDWPLHLLNTRRGNYYYIPQVMSVRNLNPHSTWGMQDHLQNVKKVGSVYDALISSGWFNEEVIVCLKKGQSNLDNSITLSEKSKFSQYKKKIIGKIIYLLNKL